MTCIAVVRGPDGVVWMGSDSRLSRGSTPATLAEPKVVNLASRVWLGSTGYATLGEALRHGFAVPERIEGEGAGAWVALKLVPAMRQHLIAWGVYSEEVSPDDDGWQKGIRGECILVVDACVFHVAQSLHAYQVGGNYFAVGSGEEVALGALHSLFDTNSDLPPETMLNKALSAATDHAEGVGPPYHVHPCI